MSASPAPARRPDAPTAPPTAPPAGAPPDEAVAAFEAVYRANVAAITGYFARRYAEPQSVADLTSETFVQAIGSLRTFDPRRGSARAWLFGIARHVYAHHCEQTVNGRHAVVALAGRRPLGDDELDQLAARIDDQRAGRELLAAAQRLSAVERGAIELVDLAGLAPREAASALGVSPGALRVRLARARKRLRTGKEPS
jgi:RNA polymerase sigma factor (sigma-70 family)